MQQRQDEVTQRAIRAVLNLYEIHQHALNGDISTPDKNRVIREVIREHQTLVDAQLAGKSNLEIELNNLREAGSDAEFKESLAEIIAEFKFYIKEKLGIDEQDVDFSEQQLNSMIHSEQDTIPESDLVQYELNKATLRLLKYADQAASDPIKIEKVKNVANIIAKHTPSTAKYVERLIKRADEFAHSGSDMAKSKLRSRIKFLAIILKARLVQQHGIDKTTVVSELEEFQEYLEGIYGKGEIESGLATASFSGLAEALAEFSSDDDSSSMDDDLLSTGPLPPTPDDADIEDFLQYNGADAQPPPYQDVEYNADEVEEFYDLKIYIELRDFKNMKATDYTPERCAHALANIDEFMEYLQVSGEVVEQQFAQLKDALSQYEQGDDKQKITIKRLSTNIITRFSTDFIRKYPDLNKSGNHTFSEKLKLRKQEIEQKYGSEDTIQRLYHEELSSQELEEAIFGQDSQLDIPRAEQKLKLLDTTRYESGKPPVIKRGFQTNDIAQATQEYYSDDIKAIQAAQRIAHILNSNDPYYEGFTEDLRTALDYGILYDERLLGHADLNTLSRLSDSDIQLALEQGFKQVSPMANYFLSYNQAPSINQLARAVDRHAGTMSFALRTNLDKLKGLIQTRDEKMQTNYKEAQNVNTPITRKQSLQDSNLRIEQLLTVLEPILAERKQLEPQQNVVDNGPQEDPFAGFDSEFETQDQSTKKQPSKPESKRANTAFFGQHRSVDFAKKPKSSSAPTTTKRNRPPKSFTEIPAPEDQVTKKATRIINQFKKIENRNDASDVLKALMTPENVLTLMEADMLTSEYGSSRTAAKGVVQNIHYFLESNDHGPSAAFRYLKKNMEAKGVSFDAPEQSSQIDFNK